MVQVHGSKAELTSRTHPVKCSTGTQHLPCERPHAAMHTSASPCACTHAAGMHISLAQDLLGLKKGKFHLQGPEPGQYFTNVGSSGPAFTFASRCMCLDSRI